MNSKLQHCHAMHVLELWQVHLLLLSGAGTAGLAYTCWHLHRHAAAISSVMGEGEIVEAALQLSRSSLKQAEVYPVQHHGWALLDGEQAEPRLVKEGPAWLAGWSLQMTVIGLVHPVGVTFFLCTCCHPNAGGCQAHSAEAACLPAQPCLLVTQGCWAAAGHAGVFATAALCFNAAVHYEERRGRMHLAAGKACK